MVDKKEDIIYRLIGLSILFDNLSFKIPEIIKETIIDATNEIINLRGIHNTDFVISKDDKETDDD